PTSPNFRDALAQVDANSVAAIYADVEGVFKLTDQVPPGGPRAQRDRAKWMQVREGPGLNGIKGAIWSGSFDGQDESRKAFVAATLINKLKDPAKAEQSFMQLGRAVTNFISGMIGRSGMVIAMRDLKDGDVTIHYLATPILRPAWTIKDGVMYVGLYPQVVSSAVAGAAAPGRKSILENESFVALRKRLGGNNVTSIRYVDLPKTAPMIYPTWLVLSSYAGFADLFGAPGPAMLIPPLNDLMVHLAPAGAVAWADEKGWHSHGVSPFPGSQVLGSDPTMSVAAPALMLSILLPSLNRARETANRVKCASNERQIGMAIMLYANENKGKYPPDLGTLLRTQDITVEVFTCPSSGNTIPPEVKTGPMDVQVAWVNGSASYVYLGAGMKNTAGAEQVVAYEKEDDHDQDGMNILYGDGHVEWQPMFRAREELQRSQNKPAAPAR